MERNVVNPSGAAIEPNRWRWDCVSIGPPSSFRSPVRWGEELQIGMKNGPLQVSSNANWLGTLYTPDRWSNSCSSRNRLRRSRRLDGA